jgi:hypothetical protein
MTNVVSLDAYRKRPSLPEPQRATEHLTVAEAIAICLRHPDILNAWEEGFLVSIRRFPRLSDGPDLDRMSWPIAWGAC